MPANSSLTSVSLEKIKNSAYELGFDLCSASSAVVPEKTQKSYLDWCASGSAADMAYMTRSPEKRTDLNQAFPGTKTVLSLGVSYFQGPFPEKPGSAYGRVARYAWGMDYHTVITERLETFLKELKKILNTTHQLTVAVDTKPILERSFAQSSGLGFIGKNTAIISPLNFNFSNTSAARFHVGSWIFLAEVLLGIPFDDVSERPSREGCGGCTNCLAACPTDAFDGPYRLKADRCISYLTIENKGWIPRDMREKLGDWIYGCDVCQDVCPFNARAKETRWPEFRADKGVGPWMLLQDIFSLQDQADFKSKWGHTPLLRAKRKGMVRNACVAAGNSQDPSLAKWLEKLLNDEEPVVRGHALWAYSKIHPGRSARQKAETVLKQEPDIAVRAECEAVLF